MVLSRGEITIAEVHDGVPEKLFRAWSNSSDGKRDFSKTESEGRSYLGTNVGLEEPAHYSEYDWTKIKGDDGEDGEDGVSIVAIQAQFATSSSDSKPPSSGWSSSQPSREDGVYIWRRDMIVFSDNETTYTTPVVVTGDKGDSGKDTYTWIRYADEPDGTGISDNPKDKMYIGFAYNKDVPKESDNPKDYVWSAMYDLDAIKDITLRDKTEILSGTEIYTDKADDDSVVHVEVDGKSVQDGEPSPDSPKDIQSVNDFDIISQKHIVNGESAIDGIEVGGRNYILNSANPRNFRMYSNNQQTMPMTGDGVEDGVDWFTQENGKGEFFASTYIPHSLSSESDYGTKFSEDLKGYRGEYICSLEVMSKEPILISLGGSDNTVKLKPNKWTKIDSGSRTAGITNRPASIYSPSQPEIPLGTKIYWRKYKLEKGTIATDWTPAPEDNPYDTLENNLYKTNILLSEPLRSVGDVKDRLFRDEDGKWKVERNLNEILVNENSNFTVTTDSTYFEKVVRVNVNHSGDVEGYPNLITSHFKYIHDLILDEEHTYISSGNLYLFISRNKLESNDVAGVKKYLKSNPVKAIYATSEPFTETLPQDLQNKLNNITSFSKGNSVYTILPDKSDILQSKLQPELHATFKSKGWYRNFVTERKIIEVDLSSKEAIKSDINQLKSEKRRIDAQYTVVYDNEDLSEEVKPKLYDAKRALNGAYDILIANMVKVAEVAAGVTPSDKDREAVQSAFNDYSDKIDKYEGMIQNAIDSISGTRFETVDGELAKVEKRVTTAESKITDDAIRNTVTSHTTFKNVQKDAEEAKNTLDSKSKTWDGKAETSYVDSKANSAETSAKNYTDKELSPIIDRVKTAEQKITDDAIRSTVTSHSTFQNVKKTADDAKKTLDSKSKSWDGKADTSYVDSKASSAESSAKSHADNKASSAERNAKNYADDALSPVIERVETAESKITKNAIVNTVRESSKYIDDLTGKVSTNEIISRINQTAEKISIDAKKIDLNGAVTISAFGSGLKNDFNAKASKSEAQNYASSAESSAKSHADTQAKNAENKAKQHADTKATEIDNKINNAVTTIDGEGVTVKDGSFFLEDDKTDTKYSVVQGTNLIQDHSFELVKYRMSGYAPDHDSNGYFYAQSSKNAPANWANSGTPRLYPGLGGNLGNHPRMFGRLAGVVNSSNYYYQWVELPITEDNEIYTLSAYYRTTSHSSSASPQLSVRVGAGEGGWGSFKTKNFPSVTEKSGLVRYSMTFNIRDLYNSSGVTAGGYLEVRVRTTNSNWVMVDGVQLVHGSYPMHYNPEESMFNFMNGVNGTMGRKIYTDEAYFGETTVAGSAIFHGDVVVSDGTERFRPVSLSINEQALWSGHAWMNQNQTVSPSKPLSQCSNGWLLVWRGYADGEGKNRDYSYTIIPKIHRHLTGRMGVHQLIGTRNYGMKTKYLYVDNGYINGNANNQSDGIVLRGVYEW